MSIGTHTQGPLVTGEAPQGPCEASCAPEVAQPYPGSLGGYGDTGAGTHSQGDLRGDTF